MTTWLLVLLALWPLFWLLRVALVVKLLIGLEIVRERITPIQPADIPEHLREAAEPLVVQLQNLGFAVLGAWRGQYGRDAALSYHELVLACPDGSVRATIRPHAEAARSGQCFVSLRSTTAGGVEIVTTSYAVQPNVPYPATLRIELLADATVAELWRRHSARLASLMEPVWVCANLAPAAGREQLNCDGIFSTYRQSTKLTRAAEDSLHYRLGAAIWRAIWLLRDAAGRKKASGKLPPVYATALSDEAQSAFDYEHYRQMLAISRGRVSLRNKSILTLVSFAAFAGVLAWRMSPAVAIALLVALVVHEGGHLVGMWWFGFKDTQLLFVPFFGGAAVGHDDKVLPPWQHIVILLLGPLPGIFAGLGIVAYQSIAGGPDWLFTAGITALVMNAFNLLPILPLDGGQIVDYAVASRFPRARVAFLAVSAIGLMLVGGVMGGVKILLGVGVVMLLQLRSEWRLAGVRVAVRSEYPDGGDEESIVRRVLTYLREAEWAKTPMAQRLQHARVLQNALRAPRAGFGTLCFAVAGYTAPVWLGVPAAVVVAYRANIASVEAANARAVAAGLVAPKAPPARPAVPDEDNGAVLVAKADDLWRGGGNDNDEIVRLLRAAGERKYFVPLPEPPAPQEQGWRRLGRPGHGYVVQQLVNAAERHLRYNQAREALGLAIDALGLVRRMDGAPEWLGWDAHEQLENSCLTTLEKALVAGARPSPEQRAAMDALADEAAEIRFAAAVIPQGMVRRVQILDELSSANASWRMRLLTQALSSSNASTRAAAIDDALKAREYLAQIEQGRWPHAEPTQSLSGSMAMVARLGDLLARERQLKVALQCAGRAAAGRADLAALQLSPGQLTHPFTGEPMRIVQRGATDVLAVGSGVGRLLGETERLDLEWRLGRE